MSLTYKLITAWFVLTTPVILWDVGYVCHTASGVPTLIHLWQLLSHAEGSLRLKYSLVELTSMVRPRSMKGGDLHWIWSPYALYQEVDYVYGVRAFENNEGFTNAQSLLNLIETALNLYYVYLANVLGTPSAPVIGFAAAVMTLSKTVLYWAQEYYCGGCSVGHNSLPDLLLLWVLPNGLWLVFPSLIIWKLGKDIGASLHASARAAARGTKKE